MFIKMPTIFAVACFPGCAYRGGRVKWLTLR